MIDTLIEKATQWAEQQQADALASGRSLDRNETALARGVGVSCPERIRLKSVPSIPVPQDAMLLEALVKTNLMGQRVAGMTIFYGVFIREGASRNLLEHEFRHVAQYERHGSIASFLEVYIPQILTVGHEHAALEKEAHTRALPDDLASILTAVGWKLLAASEKARPKKQAANTRRR